MEHPCSSLLRRHLLLFAKNAFCGWNPKKRKVEYCLLRTGTLKMKVHLNSQKYNKSLGVLNTFFKCYIIQRNNWQAVVSHKKIAMYCMSWLDIYWPRKRNLSIVCSLHDASLNPNYRYKCQLVGAIWWVLHWLLLYLITYIIIWLALWAGKMNQTARCDWLPEWARWSHLAHSGRPAASRKQNFP